MNATEQGLDRLRGVLRRRFGATFGMTLGLFIPAVLVILMLPAQYHASVVLRVLESQPAREYVAPTSVEQLAERLQTLRLALMSRPLVGEVLDQLPPRGDRGPSPAATGNQAANPRDTRRGQDIEDLRRRLNVKVEGVDTFVLSYHDPSPARAQLVSNTLVERFIAHEVARRVDVAHATAAALAAEAARLGPELKAREAELRSFKLAHYGALPEQQEQNLRLLDQLTAELNSQSATLEYQEERRRQLISTAVAPFIHQEQRLREALDEARVHYRSSHPEVQRIATELKRVEQVRQAEQARLNTRSHSGQDDLDALSAQIDRNSKIITGLREQRETVRHRLAETSRHAADLSRLSAAADTLRSKYNTVESRLREAELAVQLEERLADLRYQVVEQASLPLAAATPDRPLLVLGALVLALGLGLGLGLALDAADHTLRSPGELALIAPDLPLLACIPANTHLLIPHSSEDRDAR